MHQGLGKLRGMVFAKWLVLPQQNTSNPSEQWKHVFLDQEDRDKRWHVYFPSCLGSLLVSRVEERDWIVSLLCLLTAEKARFETVGDTQNFRTKPGESLVTRNTAGCPPRPPPPPVNLLPQELFQNSSDLMTEESEERIKHRIYTQILQEKRGKEQEEQRMAEGHSPKKCGY